MYDVLRIVSLPSPCNILQYLTCSTKDVWCVSWYLLTLHVYRWGNEGWGIPGWIYIHIYCHWDPYWMWRDEVKERSAWTLSILRVSLELKHDFSYFFTHIKAALGIITVENIVVVPICRGDNKIVRVRTDNNSLTPINYSCWLRMSNIHDSIIGKCFVSFY